LHAKNTRAANAPLDQACPQNASSGQLDVVRM
jgi:hypothetical protein